MLARISPHFRSTRTPDVIAVNPPPPPLLPPRPSSVLVRDDDYVLTFLNKELRFRLPFDWHRSSLNSGTRLWKLNLHYMEFLEGLDDARFCAVIEDWIDSNRPYVDGYWLDSWNSYALSIRCVVWMQQYAVRRQRISERFAKKLLHSLKEQLWFLLNNLETDIGGNHLIKNVKALLWGAAFFAGPLGERAGDVGRSFLRRELAKQILPDGFHFELSPSYHCQVFADLIECAAALSPSPLRSTLHETLDRMATAVVQTTHPDGLTSLLNDGGLRMTYAPLTLVNAWKAMGGNVAPAAADISFPDAGYFGKRDGGRFVICDVGRVGPDGLPAHSHGDIFSFECSLGRQRMIVDAGVYEYDSGARRAHCRSTRAHNTVTLDDMDQCELWSSFRMGRRANVFRRDPVVEKHRTLIEGWHDGYAHLRGHPIHHRRFEIAETALLINDTIQGGAGQEVRARLLFHPDASVHSAGTAGVSLKVGDVDVNVTSHGAISVGQGMWYPDFGIAHESIQLDILYGSAPCSGDIAIQWSRSQ